MRENYFGVANYSLHYSHSICSMQVPPNIMLLNPCPAIHLSLRLLNLTYPNPNFLHQTLSSLGLLVNKYYVLCVSELLISLYKNQS